MSYGFTITSKGWQLLAKLFAGETLQITRIMVGKGKVSDDINPASLTELISPVALATSTIPVINDKTTSFVAEYRNDLNGGLNTGFWLNEFGIYAFDPDVGEILLYYATLGDYPQYITAYENGAVDIRRFPVSITLTDELEVTINYPAGALVTSSDLDKHNTDIEAHADIRKLLEAGTGTKIYVSKERPEGIQVGDWWYKEVNNSEIETVLLETSAYDEGRVYFVETDNEFETIENFEENPYSVEIE